MAAAPALSSSQEQAEHAVGLRPVRLRRDLGKIADLIELAFGDTMDSAGRSAVREMRSLSQSGPLLWALASLEPGVRSMNQGFVWIDPISKALIGNVSIYNARLKGVLVIANVAVHPEFRRRGIAKALMEVALQLAHEKGATEVLLQVDADNRGAQALYESLGFVEQRVFTRWQWYPTYSIVIPEARPQAPDMMLAGRNDWRKIFALAQETRPNNQGGLGWLRPTEAKSFKKTWGEHLLNFLGMQNRQWFIARELAIPDRVLGALSMQSVFGTRYHQSELLVAPAYQGMIEEDLLSFAMRQVADTRRGLVLAHPNDDTSTNNLLKTLNFEKKRKLMHMQWRPD